MPVPDPSRPPGARARALHARAWAEGYRLIDRQLSPLGLRAIAALAPAPGAVVLDVGCGAGQTLGQLAGIVGAGGRVVGLDIARPLLAIAARRTRASRNVALVEADAQTVGLAPGCVDAVYSRFGVLGFRDPVAAFANLRGMLKPGGRLAFVCWRSLAENELDRMPLAAVGLHGPGEAAPAGLCDPRVIDDVLGRAGFRGVAIRAHSEPVSSGDLDAMTEVLLTVGPLGRIVREDPGRRAAVEPRLRAALSERGDPARVSLVAAVWIVTALAP